VGRNTSRTDADSSNNEVSGVDELNPRPCRAEHNETSQPHSGLTPQIILSFDVEEHYRIEAAAGLTIHPAQKAHYVQRLGPSTQWILDQLARFSIRGTFFVVGEIARHNAALVRAIHQAGHEVASHGWDHRRILVMTPESFRDDIRQSKRALEDVIGEPVRGYRAPTFSVIRQTAWALDVLAEEDMLYDSSIYPVRHDRYGVPAAPRAPFRACGLQHSILELPPATLRLCGVNTPMGGGGYFRLFPLFMTRWALRQACKSCSPPVATLYFHPWEFDPDQERLALSPVSRFRTYVGIKRSRGRLKALLEGHQFARAIDVAKELDRNWASLPSFEVAGAPVQSLGSPATGAAACGTAVVKLDK
jgi:polysaccharide deacetylase family protein (PEP-CTERM system associated)